MKKKTLNQKYFNYLDPHFKQPQYSNKTNKIFSQIQQNVHEVEEEERSS